jgi:pre-mRNA-splicing factor ATP-dependent RNA helicase DHX15/PRP43
LHGTDIRAEDASNSRDLLYGFKRHETTAQAASAAEDGPLNPFTGTKLSSKYMGILRTRRNLPVQQQR